MAETFNADASRKRIWGLHPNVFYLGMVSLLTDISSEMIFTLVPLFLSNVLGTATTVIGLIGGLSDSTEGILKICSGWFSDKIRRHKLLAVMGYGLAAVAKPFMYLATSWGIVLSVRLTDRVGKGIRSSPRDALVAESVPAKDLGRGFGLHRAMDTTGAFLGLALAAVIIYLVQGGGIQLSLKSYQWLVLVGVIPAVLAVVMLLIFVQEKKRLPAGTPQRSFTLVGIGGGFDTRFKIFLAIMAVFTLGNSSDFFVILRAQSLEVPLIQVVMMLALFNATYAATSLPMGILSDRVGRRRVITLGWLIYALVYLGFALASNLWQIWLLFAGYGVYYGMVEGVARAFVADLVVEEKRGTAYGLFNGVVSLALLPASLIAGWLWDAISPVAPFFFGAALAFLAMLGIMALIRE
ncbi:MFS transporter [Chloroflexota bacterium]